MPRERIVQTESEGEAENRANYALRPTRFEQYIGQEQLIRKLSIAVQAAKSRAEPVDHTLLHGPPGLGKTTLAHVIAKEVGAQVYVTNGPALTKGADLVGILTKLTPGMCFLLTRFIVCRQSSRNISIRRWRISRSIF